MKNILHYGKANSMPLWLWIDPSQACNLACSFCYTKSIHSDGNLTVPTLRSILDKLIYDEKVIIQKFNFNWRGDPLVNPNIIDLIHEIESKKPYFPWEFHTNGTLINASKAKEIVSSLKSGQVFVSIDGGNATQHEKNRGKGTFKKALDGLQALIEARGSYKIPKIGVFQLDLGVKRNQYDARFVQLASLVDNWVRISPVDPKDGRRLPLGSRSSNDNKVEKLEHEINSVSTRPEDRWWTLEVPTSMGIPNAPCFWAGNAFFISYTGNVHICLFSKTEDGKLGNIITDSIETIISKANQFREFLECNGRAQKDHCSKCRMAPGLPVQQIFHR